MKTNYEIFATMLRRPITSSSLKTKGMIENNGNFDEDAFLINLYQNKIFMEQLLVASKETYRSLTNAITDDTVILNDKKRKRDLVETLYNYWNRSCLRTTPFGLFAGVELCSFGEEDINFCDINNIVKKVNIDINWVEKYVDEFESIYYKECAFKSNNAYYEIGDRAYLMYCTDENTTGEINVLKTKLFDKIMLFCSDNFKLYKDILLEITNEYGTELMEDADNYLSELINLKFLQSSMRISTHDRNMLDTLILNMAVQKYCNEEYIFLCRLKDKILNYENEKIGEGIETYKDIVAFMSNKIKSKSYLQVDIMLNDKIVLPVILKNKIEQLAFFLQYNNSRQVIGYLDNYKYRFIEKYGTNQMVSIVELFDAGTGIGAPDNYINPQNEYFDYIQEVMMIKTEEEKVYLEAYETAVKNNGDIDLTRLIDKNYSIDESKMTISMELYFKIMSCNKNPKLFMSGAIGSNSAGSSFGRFANAFDCMDSALYNIIEKEKEYYHQDIELVELSIIPDSAREANVLRTVNYYDKELAIYTSNLKDIKQRVSLKNIYIYIKDNKFYALDIVTMKPIILKKTNMYNPERLCNEIRFLLEISDDNSLWTDFPWLRAYRNMKYIPRIIYRDIVISTKVWNISLSNFADFDKIDNYEAENIFLDYCMSNNISNKFYLAIADNQILIDINDTQDRKQLVAYIKKIYRKYNKKAYITIKEAEDGELYLQNQYGENYNSEIVVALFNKSINKLKNSKSNMEIRISKNEREKIPFEDWLYLKIYIKQVRQTEFLANYLFDLFNGYYKKLSFFYMRYADPVPHIRIRINGDMSILLDFYKYIQPKLKALTNTMLIANIEIATYDREIERYGGVNIIEPVEELFCIDSIIVINIIKKIIENSYNDFYKNVIYMMSIIHYLKMFFGDINNILKYFEVIGVKNISPNSSLKADKNCYLDAIKAALTDNNGGYITDFIQEYNSRNDYINKVIKGIKENKINKERVINIVDSIIHLSNNRMFGIDRKKERNLLEIVKCLFMEEYFKGRSKK
jgi:subtilin biosynthesis protein spaB